MSDAFLAERDAHCVRDAGFARDARLRRVSGTHRITYHSAAASLITYLQTGLIDAIIHGRHFCESDLRTIVKELLSFVNGSEFVSNLCMRYEYELLPNDDNIKVDYIIDLDTHLLIKPKC